jgi:cyclin-dependent kinase 7
MLRTPYLPGESDMDQLKTIFRALGTPTEEEWPVCIVFRPSFFFSLSGLLYKLYIKSILSQGYTKLPDYVSVGQFPRTPLRDLFTAASGDTLNLLSKCIIYEPRKRINARDVRTVLSFFFHPPFLLSRHLLISLAGSKPPLLLRTSVPYTSLEATENGRADGRFFSTARRSRRERRLWWWHCGGSQQGCPIEKAEAQVKRA